MTPETKADLWVIFLEEIQSTKDLAAGMDYDTLDGFVVALQTLQQEWDENEQA
jgi:hypothetical protein